MKLIMIYSKKFFALGMVALMLSSCQCNRNKAIADYDNGMDSLNTSTSSMEEDINKSRTILYTLPAPIEMASLIKETGVRYDEELLNPLSKSNQYTTNMKMAINLGIYTTDMSVASMFNQSQKTMEYLNTIKGLTQNLGIMQIVDEKTMSKFDKKETSKNEILNIISEVYMNANQYLTENNRKNVAVMVLIGGWTEGFNIALELAKVTGWKNQKLQERILAQKLSLQTVLDILQAENKNGEDEDLTYLTQKMNEIKVIFDEVRFETLGSPVINIDSQTKSAVIKAPTQGQLTPDLLELLCEKVKAIRSEFVD